MGCRNPLISWHAGKQEDGEGQEEVVVMRLNIPRMTWADSSSGGRRHIVCLSLTVHRLQKGLSDLTDYMGPDHIY